MAKLLAIAAIICIVAVTESKFTCDKTCSTRRVKICDQYGVRYRNLCEFQKAKKCAGGNPSLIKNDCNKFSKQINTNRKQNINCALSSSEELPLRCQNKQPTSTGPETTTAPVWTEKREIVCEENCPLIFDPICGSDGITYPSKCVLDALSCSREKDAILNKDPDYIKLVGVSMGQCPVPTSSTVG
ncbi:ovoinhibitor-like [Anneissia japonica]|uniref:ovoinhibitor-like n=1 Tax=Anneissia japonica TaxID=1529436 RepID=UPI00142584B9|nr:ovoinhibitor-like [Anneissia japonica]